MKHVLCPVFVLLVIVGYVQAAENTPAFIELEDFYKIRNTNIREHVRFVAFSLDSKKIVTTSPRYIAKIWDADTGKELKKLDDHVEEDGVELSSGSPSELFSAAFTPDGKKLVTSHRDQCIRIWDIDTGKKIQALKLRGEAYHSFALSPDGKTIATPVDIDRADNNNAIVIIWDIETGQELRTLPHPDMHFGRVSSATFSPDGKKIVTHMYGDDNRFVRIWDAESGKELRKLEHPNDQYMRVCSAVFSPDGKKIVSVTQNGIVRIWDVDSGKELQKIKGHTVCFSHFAPISPDGKKIAMVAGAPKTAIRIWDVDTGKELQRLREHNGDGYAMLSADFSPDGKTIVTTSNYGAGIVRIWDVDTGKSLRTLSGHEYELFFALFSPDGRKIVVTSGDRHHGSIINTRLWNLSMRVDVE